MRPQHLCLILLAAGCASEPTLEPVVDPEPATEPHVPSPHVQTPAVEPETPKSLQLTAPEGWVSETPKNNMRKAQFSVPRAEGDPADASVVVFYFGGRGGSVDANVDRWAAQFTQEDGGSTRERTELEERTVNEMKTTFVDMAGRYVAETAPGSGERIDRPDYRMLAAIVESDHGPYFVKFVGPKATIAKWADAFEAYIESAQ